MSQEELDNDPAHKFADGNPMLRDGVSGDWYTIQSRNANEILTGLGLVPSLAIKEQSGKPVFLQTRPWRLQHLQTIQRKHFSTYRMPSRC